MYSALPLSPVWMTWMVALVPSGMLSLASAARPASRMQNVPLPVWLKPVTSETLKLVTLFPRPRLMYVGAHWWPTLRLIEPPVLGQAVRLVTVEMLAPIVVC